MIIPVLDITVPQIWPQHTLEASIQDGELLLTSGIGESTREVVLEQMGKFKEEISRRRKLPSHQQY